MSGRKILSQFLPVPQILSSINEDFFIMQTKDIPNILQ